jgi:hypothetical protein
MSYSAKVSGSLLDDIIPTIDPRSRQRGEAYFLNHQVLAVGRENETVDARVEGSHLYHVRLEVQGEQVKGRCTCPIGAGCKHIAAAAICVETIGWDHLPPIDADRRQHLESLTQTELVELILRRANHDYNFGVWLDFQTQHDDNLDALKVQVDAVRHGIDHSPGHWEEFGRQADVILDIIEDMLDTSGDDERLAELISYASQQWEAIDGFIDDAYLRLSDLNYEYGAEE